MLLLQTTFAFIVDNGLIASWNIQADMEPPPPYPGTASAVPYPSEKKTDFGAAYPAQDTGCSTAQPNYPVQQPAAQPVYPVQTGVVVGQPGYAVTQGYSASMQAPVPAASVTTTTVLVNPIISLGPFPVTTTCPRCCQAVCTNVKYIPGSFAWVICLILALLG